MFYNCLSVILFTGEGVVMSVPVTDNPPTAPPLPPDSTAKQHLPVNKWAVRILLEYLFAIYFLKKKTSKNQIWSRGSAVHVEKRVLWQWIWWGAGNASTPVKANFLV